MLFKIKNQFKNLLRQIHLQRIENIQCQNGKIMSNFVNSGSPEFQVFSQFGEDGIIEYLIQLTKVENKCFLEFGVEDYSESNTRFLLFNRNWSSVVIDSDYDNVESIISSYYSIPSPKYILAVF